MSHRRSNRACKADRFGLRAVWLMVYKASSLCQQRTTPSFPTGEIL